MRSTILHAGRQPGWWPLLMLAFLSCPCLQSPASAQSVAPATPPDDDAFARRAWHLDLSAHKAFETWNYNTSREEMIGILTGLTYGLGKGVTLTARSQLYYVDQRGTDSWLLGATIGVRGRVYRRARTSIYYEIEVGISEADTIVPPRGTRFNYLALGGAGATIRIAPGLHLLTGLKWVHVSNGGLAGRSRNPDIEAVGLIVGTLIAF
jgi:Lipid A 3-O-deacylase (PagL)